VSSKPFAARPPGAQAWVRDEGAERATPFTARLTIDVTPASRGRIKIAAFSRGQTVADMLRDLFDREYPQVGDDPS
jgi:hypothetical protein